VKYPILFLLFILIPLNLFGNDEIKNIGTNRNLEGWTVYSNDESFDTSELEKKGVQKRQVVIEKIKKNPERLYSYDICASHLRKLLPDVLNQEKEEIQAFCSRSLNIEEHVFLAIYRKKYDKKKLVKFRGKMNEIFMP